jgi:acyl carrier protein
VAEPAVEPGALRTYLKQRLPEYMVPAALVPLDAIPFSPNGKLDRSALPEYDSVRSAQPQTYVAPRNPVEEAVAGAWRELLDLEQVSVQDNFFELGGHSLLATQATSWVQESFEIAMPLQVFFEHPTIAEQAAYIETACQAANIDATTVASVLVRLQDLSDDEVRAMLAEREGE